MLEIFFISVLTDRLRFIAEEMGDTQRKEKKEIYIIEVNFVSEKNTSEQEKSRPPFIQSYKYTTIPLPSIKTESVQMRKKKQTRKDEQ